MNSQLTLDRSAIELTIESSLPTICESNEELASYHDCLVGSYMSYLKAAGYSKIPHEIRVFERGARRFLGKFSDPQLWVALPVEEQRRCNCKERSFVHYLILRRLLPMPIPYMLTRKPRFFQMATRLIERETFQLYQKAAQRLGYQERSIKSQFCPLLCLMIWTQKPIQALTLDDLNTFRQELRNAYMELASRYKGNHLQNGLPKRWDGQLNIIRTVLFHMGIFPQLIRSTRRTSFDKQWKDVPVGIAVPVRRYLQQMALSLRPESAYQEKVRLFRADLHQSGGNQDRTHPARPYRGLQRIYPMGACLAQIERPGRCTSADDQVSSARGLILFIHPYHRMAVAGGSQTGTRVSW